MVFEEDNTQMTIHDDNSTIDFKYLMLEDIGSYRCEANSRVGHVAQEVSINIKSKSFIQ